MLGKVKGNNLRNIRFLRNLHVTNFYGTYRTDLGIIEIMGNFTGCSITVDTCCSFYEKLEY